MSQANNEGVHSKLYKNSAKSDVADSRRRRTENSIEIRRQKRNDEMMKRRNIDLMEDENGKTTSATKNEQEIDNADVEKVPILTLDDAMKKLQNNPSLEELQTVCHSLRRVLSAARDPPIDAVIKHGFLDAFVKALQINDERVQFEAAWALTNIVSGTSEQTNAAVQSGVAGPLVRLIYSPSTKVSEQAIWACANIVGDSPHLRDLMIKEGIIEALTWLALKLPSLNTSFLRIIAWTLSNLVRHKQPQVGKNILAQIVPIISGLFVYQDVPSQQDACWALSFLTDGADDNIELTLACGVVPYIVSFLNGPHVELIPPCLRILGNFSTGADHLTQVVVDTGILKNVIPNLIVKSTSNNVKECCWLISNIAAGTHEQIQAVLDAGLIPLVLDVLLNGESRGQLEASWVISNIVHGGTNRQVLFLANTQEALSIICKSLHNKHMEIVINMLDTLSGIMKTIHSCDPGNVHKAEITVEEAGGLDALEALQNHESERIYELSYRIVREYFNNDDEEGIENFNPEEELKMDHLENPASSKN